MGEVSEHDLASIASEARHVADLVPRDDGLDAGAPPLAPSAEQGGGSEHQAIGGAAGYDGGRTDAADDTAVAALESDFDFDFTGGANTDEGAEPAPAAPSGLETEELDASALEAIALGGDTLQDVKLEGFDFTGLALEDISYEPVVEDDTDADPSTEQDSLPEPGPASDGPAPAAERHGGEAEQSADRALSFDGFDFDGGDASAAVAAEAPEQERSGPDLAALEQRIAGLSLADTDSYGNGPERGAVVIEGGLGGPDAVRQLLAAIPPGFPRPLLVRLRLDGGRYDRLVRQMERAAQLPVTLAEDGAAVEPGHVYFLPPDIGVARERAQLRFVSAEGASAALPASLPSDDSAVLFLSGSDPALVDAAMGQAWGGALVAGQSPEGCYDGAAADIVIARGGRSGTPRQLADELAERWPPPDRPAGAHLEEPTP
ncbi:chemotaxis protein CheB [Luteimonas sp. RD2P54]|uniref:protein-glutamate methylesterase n=2 Tax=Luteimonas endophytica TaxID=3042023 RepID=A0ABT6J5X3_9GAMM|nr:chemotaxis protein CheB [Luteimonas endophytica]MDH5822201.1 chemotaxis protein CheB [Luteimonas endophytica]